MKYYVIGDEDTVTGFRLAGVDGTVVTSRSEAEESFEEALKDHENGIVIMPERIAELMREKVDRYVFSEQFPLIVEIPDRLGTVEGKLGLRELVNKAVGIGV